MEKVFVAVITSLVGAVVGLGVYIWTRTITEHDKMIASLFRKNDDHEKRLSHLE